MLKKNPHASYHQHDSDLLYKNAVMNAVRSLLTFIPVRSRLVAFGRFNAILSFLSCHFIQTIQMLKKILLERYDGRLLLLPFQTLKETKRKQVIMFDFKYNVLRICLLKRFANSVDDKSKEN